MFLLTAQTRVCLKVLVTLCFVSSADFLPRSLTLLKVTDDQMKRWLNLRRKSVTNVVSHFNAFEDMKSTNMDFICAVTQLFISLSFTELNKAPLTSFGGKNEKSLSLILKEEVRRRRPLPSVCSGLSSTDETTADCQLLYSNTEIFESDGFAFDLRNTSVHSFKLSSV